MEELEVDKMLVTTVIPVPANLVGGRYNFTALQKQDSGWTYRCS